MFGMIMDSMGERVLHPSEWEGAKSKQTHPYNYDPILLFLRTAAPKKSPVSLKTGKRKASNTGSKAGSIKGVASVGEATLQADGTVYTDHLIHQDFEKHDALCERHFGNTKQYWDSRRPADIEAFLRDWCDDADLVLVKVIEYCDQSNGYPTWRLDYKRGAQAGATSPQTVTA